MMASTAPPPAPARLALRSHAPGKTSVKQGGAARRRTLRWSRLSEQIFRVDKWSVCRPGAASQVVEVGDLSRREDKFDKAVAGQF
jgi:hypothetical protein